MIIQIRSVSKDLDNHRLIIRMHTDEVLHGRQETPMTAKAGMAGKLPVEALLKLPIFRVPYAAKI